jgi:hypothetical protein
MEAQKVSAVGHGLLESRALPEGTLALTPPSWSVSYSIKLTVFR